MESDLQRVLERMQCWCAGDAAARIEQLLLGSITSPQEASRLCAVQWANRLFPFQHVPARYICALAAGDIKLEIREEGQSGLKPPKPQPGNLSAIV
jgi:proteasome component ECM29